jgi:hypothetical protein
MRPLGRLTAGFVAVALLATGCSGSPATPADPLGVQERLAAAPDAVGWQVCTVLEQPEENAVVDRSRSAGVFTPTGPDAVTSRQEAATASGPVETYAFSGSDIVVYHEPGSLYAAGWNEPLSLYDVAASAATLLDPNQAIAALGVDAITPDVRTDANGGTYAHYESLPADSWDSPGSGEPWPAETLLGYPIYSVVYAVDIWTDADGRTERIRLRTQDMGRRWAELRFTETAKSPDGSPILPDCPDRVDEPPPPGWIGFEPWDQQHTVPLRVALDPAGRPYDVVPSTDATIRHERYGTVHTGDGTIVVMDGNALEVDMAYFSDQGSLVDFGSPTDLNVQIIWEQFPEWEVVLGVRLDRPGTVVDHWESWEFGYVTDGGVGGFTTGTVMAEAQRRGDASLDENLSTFTADLDDVVLVDLDGVDGADTMVFYNGWGDGGFPMARGLDASGQVVSLYIFDLRYPWRLAIPDGTPPPNVTAREQEYIECLDGTREVLPDGECVADNFAF